MVDQGQELFGIVDPLLYYVIISIVAFSWLPILIVLWVKKELRDGKKQKLQVIRGGKVNRVS